jgi:hypothetical protein
MASGPIQVGQASASSAFDVKNDQAGQDIKSGFLKGHRLKNNKPGLSRVCLNLRLFFAFIL